jgi:hypothetical protein
MEFLLLVKLHGRIDQAGSPNIISQMILGQDESENDLIDGDSLGLAFLAQLGVARFDILFRFAVQPQAEILVDMVGAIVDCLSGKSVVRRGARVGLKVFNQGARQLLRMVFDHPDQAIR